MFDFLKNKFMDESLEDQINDLGKFPGELNYNALNGLSCDRLPNSSGEFGKCLTNPIPVNGPIGEIKYINRLRTNDGGLIFHRLKSSNGIDIFEVVSVGGKIWDLIYLDMYHPRRSIIIPHGYTASEFNEIFSRFSYGYFTNNLDTNFPFGLSVFIEKGLGGKNLAEQYEKIIEDKSKFIRTPEHIKKLMEINAINKSN